MVIYVESKTKQNKVKHTEMAEKWLPGASGWGKQGEVSKTVQTWKKNKYLLKGELYLL